MRTPEAETSWGCLVFLLLLLINDNYKDYKDALELNKKKQSLDEKRQTRHARM